MSTQKSWWLHSPSFHHLQSAKYKDRAVSELCFSSALKRYKGRRKMCMKGEKEFPLPISEVWFGFDVGEISSSAALLPTKTSSVLSVSMNHVRAVCRSALQPFPGSPGSWASQKGAPAYPHTCHLLLWLGQGQQQLAPSHAPAFLGQFPHKTAPDL